MAQPLVREAMAEAMGACVDIVELQALASTRIAAVTGGEAGLATAGAAAGLLLGTAACVAGLDPARMARLPEVRGAMPEAIMVRSQRNQYDHALRGAGVRIVEVGLPDRYAGAGCRDAEPWEIEAAINERTVLVHWVADAQSRPALEDVVKVAHAHGLPVLVDAAAQLPPQANLRRFIEAGADLVVFSGGKALGGPQGSGILAGRQDLIASAALQMLDMDYPTGFFRPPAAFIDAAALKGLPPHGIGRVAKVGKEQIVGLLVALEAFIAEGDEARFARWLSPLQTLFDELAPGFDGGLDLRRGGAVPLLGLYPAGGAEAAHRLYADLVQGEPVIHTDPEELDLGAVILNPIALVEGDVARILARLDQISHSRS
ncbi:MAG: aminotransferase class V-fold PLP-dependent enzyme [Geminicoccaceae bacterium]|nr:MAG: aminotransferase class V-fold PLP-dependent enzyme [Geminicoccaceae bacterium]